MAHRLLLRYRLCRVRLICVRGKIIRSMPNGARTGTLSLNIDIGLDSRVADGVLHYLDNSHPPTDVRYDLNDEKDVRRLYETVKEYGDSFLDE